MDRRALIGTAFGIGAAAVSSPAAAQSAGGGSPAIPLWPGRPPGAPPQIARPRDLRGTAAPSLRHVRAARPDGRAMLVIPGGGYEYVSVEGGRGVADRLARHGITCFVLEYRLPIDGWTPRADIPLQDAQRAYCANATRPPTSSFAIPKRPSVASRMRSLT